MMTNRMEGDEGAKTALETRNFMYFPLVPQVPMDYHNKSTTLLKKQSTHQIC